MKTKMVLVTLCLVLLVAGCTPKVSSVSKSSSENSSTPYVERSSEETIDVSTTETPSETEKSEETTTATETPSETESSEDITLATEAPSLITENVDDALYKLCDDYSSPMISVERLLEEIRNGNWDMPIDFLFDEEDKSYLNSHSEQMKEFSESLNQFNSELISNEFARERFKELKEVVTNDSLLFSELIELYNLFYDYVQNDYLSSDRDKIIERGNMDEILSNFDKAVEKSRDFYDKVSKLEESLSDEEEEKLEEDFATTSTTVMSDLYKITFGEDHLQANYYFEFMGRIQGAIENEKN